jgi:hypothetical protein
MSGQLQNSSATVRVCKCRPARDVAQSRVFRQNISGSIGRQLNQMRAWKWWCADAAENAVSSNVRHMPGAIGSTAKHSTLASAFAAGAAR